VRNPLRSLFEARSIASSSELLQHLLHGGYLSISGQRVTEATALNVLAVWTGVSIRSRLLSTLPIDVIERVDARSVRQLPDHPVAKVFLKPNSWQTKSELFGMLEAHRVLRGNAYGWKNYVTGLTRGGPTKIVSEIIPLHPDQTEVVDQPDDFGGPTTYKYHRSNGSILTFPSREILHLKGLSTDGRKGRPVLQDLREVIGGALATQEHANSLWSRDATPSIVLSHPKTLSPGAKKGLEDAWEKTYGRNREKKRVAVIEEGMQIKQLSLSPEDGQFLETSQDMRAQLAAALMVPPFMMGLAEKATSWGTGIEQQQIGLLTFTMRPDITTWQERLHLDTVDESEQARIGLRFNIRAFLQGDARSQFESFWRGIQMGVYSPNDVRALLDMNPIVDGDIYLQPTNMAPLGFVPAGSATNP
jgi:HK97 family phage portal protein